MNVDRACTDAFGRYQMFHEEFNRLLPVGTAGFVALGRLVDVHNGSELLGALVDSAGEPWAKRRQFPEPRRAVDAALTLYCNMAIVRSQAGFDDYTAAALLDAAEFSDPLRNSPSLAHVHASIATSPSGKLTGCCRSHVDTLMKTLDLSGRVETLGVEFGWDKDLELTAILPLFHYFRRARNRIVHGDGTVGERLEAYASSTEVSTAVAAWNSLHSKHKAPALPALTKHHSLAFLPRHAILAQSVAYAIGKRLDAHLAKQFGVNGFVMMATYYSLIASEHPYRGSRVRHHASAVNAFLARYRVRKLTRGDTISALKAVGLRDHARKRFLELYGKPLAQAV